SIQQAQAQANSAAQSLDTASAQYDQKVAPSVQADLDSARAGVEGARAQLQQQLAAAAEAVLRAPRAGTIGVVNGAVGQWTTGPTTDTTKSLVVLTNLSELTIQAQVSESDVGDLKVGDKVGFTVDAWPNDRFTGTVASMTSVGQTTQNVVTYQLVV